jgi:branched-chain amino acid transport system permease protein
MIEALIQQVVLGVLLGGLYGIAAIGLALVFGVMRVLNVSHGELIMLGGYAGFWLFYLYGLDPYLAVPLILAIFLLVGLGLQRGLFIHVMKLREEVRIKNSLLISFALSLMLHNIAILLWTADERSITTSYAGLSFSAFNIALPAVRMGGFLLALVAAVILQQILTRTYLGKAIRATAENWEAASLMGINIQRVYAASLAIGSALAGIAGTLVAVAYFINPAIGLEWTLKALIVIVLAGLGNLSGAFLGGLVLGVAEALGGYFVGMIYRDLVALILFLLILILKPEGLFAREKR